MQDDKDSDIDDKELNIPDFTYPVIMGETHLYYGDLHNESFKFLNQSLNPDKIE